MTKLMMDRLLNAAFDLDIDMDEHESYSCRGMYGEQTCAITVNTLMEFAAVCVQVGASLPDDACLDQFAKDVLNLRTDNLGHQIIIY